MTKSSPETLKAPRHLRPETRAWWLSVVTGWSLEPHHIKLLTSCAESFDRAAQARQLVDRDGLTVPIASGGCRAHPAVAIERDARLTFARLLRELDLDVAPPQESARRPPTLRSMRGRLPDAS